MSDVRPAGIECDRWRPKSPGSKRCYYYIDGGACGLDTYFMCIEWLQSNYGFRNHLEHVQANDPIVKLEKLAEQARAKRLALQAPIAGNINEALASLAALAKLRTP